MEQRDPKHQVQPDFFVIQGLPIEHRRLNEFLQTCRPELALDSPPNLLLLGKPPLLPRFSAESREARQRLKLYQVRRPKHHQLRHQSARRSRLVQDPLQRPELASGLVPPIQRDSTGHKDKFNNYTSNRNVVNQGFNGYATSFTGRSSKFVKSDSINASWIFSGKLEREIKQRKRKKEQKWKFFGLIAFW